MICRTHRPPDFQPREGVCAFSPLSTLRSQLSPGFTFIEVLFAIIILGIGSIMIAGMLPVAIKQTSDTRNAITGKAACEAGYAYLQAIATTANLPATNIDTNQVNNTNIYTASMPSSPPTVTNVLETPTPQNPPVAKDYVGKVIPLSYGTLAAGDTAGPFAPFQSTIGSRVLASDPRTQWLAFYGRSLGSNTATLVLLALHLQNTESISGYVQTTPTPINTLKISDANNGPFLLNAEITNGGALDADKITLTNPNGGNGMLAVDSGAFVIVANNYTSSLTNDALRGNRNNGRVFRLGKLVSGIAPTGPLVYELQPGYDLPALSYGPDNVPNTTDDIVDNSMNTTVDGNTVTQVWIVGRGLQNPSLAYNASTNPYVGLVQDVGVLTTQLQLSN